MSSRTASAWSPLTWWTVLSWGRLPAPTAGRRWNRGAIQSPSTDEPVPGPCRFVGRRVLVEHGDRCGHPCAHRLVERGHGGSDAVKQPFEHCRVDVVCGKALRRGAVVGVGVPPAQHSTGEDVTGPVADPGRCGRVLRDDADGPGQCRRGLRRRRCGRAGVGLGQGGLSMARTRQSPGLMSSLVA